MALLASVACIGAKPLPPGLVLENAQQACDLLKAILHTDIAGKRSVLSFAQNCEGATLVEVNLEGTDSPLSPVLMECRDSAFEVVTSRPTNADSVLLTLKETDWGYEFDAVLQPPLPAPDPTCKKLRLRINLPLRIG